MDEDWKVLMSFLPSGWQRLATETGALKGLRKDKSVENLLRTLLLHVGCGYSLRETVVRARKANLADFTAVALMKRLRKSKDWLQALCVELFREQGVVAGNGFQIRAFDATTVKEPGMTGALWRIHYSVCLPALVCDFFKITTTFGRGSGESFSQFPIRDGDHILADRGYSTARGIGHVVSAGGHVTVRVNTGSLSLETETPLLEAVGSLERAGAVGSWAARAVVKKGVAIPGRLCANRRSDQNGAGQTAEGCLKQAASTGHPGIRAIRHPVHDVFRSCLHCLGRAELVPHPLAARLQKIQVFGAIGASTQIRRRERQGMALRKITDRPAGGKTDPPRHRRFPLGMRDGNVRIAHGGISGSCCIRSHARSSLVSPSSRRSRNGMSSQNRWLNHGVAVCLN